MAKEATAAEIPAAELAAPAEKPVRVKAVMAEAPAPAPLSEDRWGLLESRNPGFWSCVPHAVTIDHLQEPSYWANVARHMRPCTTFQVHWDDSSQFAEFYCLAAGRNWASVSLLRHHKLDKPVIPQAANRYGVAFNGPVDKFRITRLNDGAVIRAGFPSETEARKFLDEYVRKLSS
jgi:hypothetical protein